MEKTIEEILVEDILTKEEQKPRSVRMSGKTNSDLKKTTKETKFSQDTITKLGCATARKIHAELKKRALNEASQNYKKKKAA